MQGLLAGLQERPALRTRPTNESQREINNLTRKLTSNLEKLNTINKNIEKTELASLNQEISNNLYDQISETIIKSETFLRNIEKNITKSQNKAINKTLINSIQKKKQNLQNRLKTLSKIRKNVSNYLYEKGILKRKITFGENRVTYLNNQYNNQRINVNMKAERKEVAPGHSYTHEIKPGKPRYELFLQKENFIPFSESNIEEQEKLKNVQLEKIKEEYKTIFNTEEARKQFKEMQITYKNLMKVKNQIIANPDQSSLKNRKKILEAVYNRQRKNYLLMTNTSLKLKKEINTLQSQINTLQSKLNSMNYESDPNKFNSLLDNISILRRKLNELKNS